MYVCMFMYLLGGMGKSELVYIMNSLTTVCMHVCMHVHIYAFVFSYMA